MTRRTDKIDHILDVAIGVLETEGDFGITMRKVAANAEMSLSNLQYYFKNRDELLKAVADRYFQQCLANLDPDTTINNRRELGKLVRELLNDVVEVSYMCRIFREYWAISTRNEAINAYLVDYYRSLLELMKGKLRPLARDDESLSHAAAILISFVEGYSVTVKSLPIDVETMADALEAIVIQNLGAKRN